MAMFSEWLTKELNDRQWSHNDLAGKAGVSRPLVSHVLRGDTPPSAEFCIKVANAVGVAPETVLRMADFLPPANDPLLQEITDIAANLPQQQQTELLQFAKFLLAQTASHS